MAMAEMPLPLELVVFRGIFASTDDDSGVYCIGPRGCPLDGRMTRAGKGGYFDYHKNIPSNLFVLQR